MEKLQEFQPRKYCVENLSLEKSAEIYANIISGKQKPWSTI